MRAAVALLVCAAVLAVAVRGHVARPPLTPHYYDPASPDHTLTDEYAVVFHEDHKDSVDVHELGARHGMRWLERIAHVDDVHIFVHENQSSALPLLTHSREVKWAERQVLRRRYKRTADPMWGASWFLHDHNSEDLNVKEAWDIGFDGNGVTVAICDDGIWHNHDEFLGKFRYDVSRDLNFGDDDVDPYHWDVHGTAAAGVATAIGDNGKCGVGVAPGASIAGIRILARDASDSIEAQGITWKKQEIDVYSNSWGPNDNGQTLEGPGRMLARAMDDAIATGRDGKGNIFVWACGNGREQGDTCNYDGYANSRYVIPIGSYEWNGKQAYYSESCAALVAVTPSSDRSGHQLLSANVDNNCYTHFGGTSASSPAVAGVVALMLQARPELTWRDVQGVMITTAQPIQTDDESWATNAVGVAHSYKYGFGRVDAAATVRGALTWTLLPEAVDAGGHGSTGDIPDNKPHDPFVGTATVDDNFVIEFVEVDVEIQHRHRGELALILESPSGSVSLLAEPHNDISANYYWQFTSRRHWGEQSAGVWKLYVGDSVRSNAGRVNKWSVHVYGHRA